MLRTTLPLSCLVLLSSVAYAGNNELSLSESRRALHTDSANAVTSDGMVGGSLAYARRVDLPMIPRLTVWGTANFGWGGASGEMFQTMQTDISTLMLSVGGRANYKLHRLVVATGRLDLGSSRAALTLRDDAGHSASDHGWAPMTQAALGLDLYAVNKPTFSLGLRFELGYIAMGSVDMTGKSDSGSNGTLQLQMTAAGLGGLNLSGSTFAASVVSQF